MRWGVAVGAAFVLLGARPAAADLPCRETRLPNGLEVVVDEGHSIPFVTVVLRYGVGGAMEPDGKRGLAELTTWLMTQHTRHVSQGSFARLIADAGGNWGFGVGVESTELWITLPARFVELALWLLSDGMGFLAVDDATIANRVEVMRLEREQRLGDATGTLAHDLRLQEMYPEGHPYRRVNVGVDRSDLRDVTANDVRAFAQQWFTPTNAVLAIAGYAQFDDVEALAKKYFGTIAPGPTSNVPVATVPPLRGETRFEIGARVASPRVVIAWPTPAHYAKGDAELDAVAGLLDGPRIAQLSWELRQRRNVVTRVTAYQQSSRRGSVFYIDATVAAGHQANEVIAAVDDVLRKLVVTPLSDEEVVGSVMRVMQPYALSFERPQARARRYASMLSEGQPLSMLEGNIKRYILTDAEVREAARSYLPLDRRVISITQPDSSAPIRGVLRSRQFKAAP